MADYLFAYGSKPGSGDRGRLILADGAWFAVAAMAALAIGTAGDRFLRHPALGWHYRPAAERVLDSSTAAGAAISLISLDEMQAALKKPGVMVLDARPGLFFEMGHLPGAQSLPREDFEASFGPLEPGLRIEDLSVMIYCTDPGL